MFKMKNTTVYMVLRGRRVVEWVRGRGVGPGVVTNQRAEHLWNVHDIPNVSDIQKYLLHTTTFKYVHDI
jgi:hypothetical protein